MRNRNQWAICLTLVSLAATVSADTDILIAGFEGKDYGGWTATGEAFGPGPARGTLPRQMHVSGFKGNGLVNSFLNGDDATGTLTAPPFRIERKHINFLIGGGKYPGETCINLIVEGKVVRTATGPNDSPGGSERLDWHSWDVADLIGRSAILQIVDRRAGGWGHINIDHIVQSNVTIEEFAMKLKIENRYVHLPVKNGAEKIAFEFLRDGKMVREFDVELALDQPDWWAFYDVTAFKGQEIVVKAKGKVPEQIADKLAGMIKQGDDIIGAEDLYREPLRPQFHFTSRRGWNNDPNGMVFHDGEYHLFYQHNPFGIKWGNMHWGHAVSTDMIHWKELPIALYQNSLKDMAFSGGGAVDQNNTAGFKTGKDDAIIVSFTCPGRGECIAYSNDRGRTFTDYDGNPVVKHRGRDPKIVWFEPQRKWVMVLYDEVEDKWRYAFHESKDLKSWSYMSAVDGFYECPDFFELPVDGDANNRKWVLYGAERREEGGKRFVARSSYRIGAFDGRTFTPKTGILTGHLGPNYYAAQSFSHAPGGRCVMMGWLCGATYPNMPFSQGMTVPLELSLRTTPEGIRLFFTPVKELDALHTQTHRGANLTIEAANKLLSETAAELLDIRADIAPADFTLTVRGIPIVYNAARQELSCRGAQAKLPPLDGAIRLHVLVDRGALELYGNGGLVGMSFGGAIYSNDRSIHFTGDPAVRLRSLEIHEMASAWQ